MNFLKTVITSVTIIVVATVVYDKLRTTDCYRKFVAR